ncbi:MAG: type II toxin-antitoxin system RelE/ParE family toxin [Elusimicrobia bacterium]|nr:type II toxin-antitoxin system RelE/ParE family toxin [Elusimicrobiota bacterium]
MYCVEFWRDAGGGCPARDFLDGLPVKVRAKTAKWLQLLQEGGPDLKRPYADMLADGIRELRLSFGRLEVRLLYFIEGREIVLTNGFLKKTRHTPTGEIERARRSRAVWLAAR